MRHLAVIVIGALATLGCEEAMREPNTGTGRVCFLETGGAVKECHDEAVASNLDFTSTEVRVRCWQTVEGQLVNCTMLRGPDVAHYDIIEAARRTRVPPKIVAGRPAEGWVFLVSRMQIVDHR
jgi:hypothetical protein